jgi:hypothetical protein
MTASDSEANHQNLEIGNNIFGREQYKSKPQKHVVSEEASLISSSGRRTANTTNYHYTNHSTRPEKSFNSSSFSLVRILL